MGKKGEQLMEERGLMTVLAYHCIRCNYLWFPRDYDPAYDDIERMEPPKACARCKSKYWNQIPCRKIEHSVEQVGSIARKRAVLRSQRLKAETKAKAEPKSRVSINVKTPPSPINGNNSKNIQLGLSHTNHQQESMC